jgi:hypothetical protein
MNRISRRLGPLLCLLLLSGTAPWALAQHQLQKISPDNLSHYWILLSTNVDVDLPNSGKNLNVPVCVAVTYDIGSDGKPMNAKVGKMVPASDLAPAAVGMVSRFEYGPYEDLSKKPAAPKGGSTAPQDTHDNRAAMPVSTYYIVPFNAPDDPAAHQALIDSCKLPGYGA